jgi:hypothetical protein
VKRLLVAVAVVVLGLARPAAAHDVRGEVVLLDIGDHAIDVELRVPARQLETASGIRLGHEVAAAVRAQQADLRAYAARMVGARSEDRREWAVDVGPVAYARHGDQGEVVFHAHLIAPAGATARWFALRDDLVLGRVTTANVYVFVRSDLQTGILDGEPALLGYLHYQQRELVVDRNAGSRARGLVAVFKLGARHIADGTDHLLFLLVLLIPAPLLASAGRWAGRRTVRSSLLATARIVTAFTLGHSLTLIIGAVHGAVLPTSAVESLIAVSILVTAAHAARPVFPDRESLIALAFGLIHGLAFAATLSSIGVDGVSLAIGVLGFNLGVEAMQLAILVVTVPWLLMLARHPVYRAVRVVVAAGAAIAATAWLAERALGLRTPVPAVVERLAGHAGWGLAALVIGSVTAELVARHRTKTAATHEPAITARPPLRAGARP